MANAVPKRGHGLSTQNATRCIGHGAADDQRQTLATGFEVLFNRKQRGFGVERIENRFDQQHVAAAVDQGFRLLVIRETQFFKCDVARASVVHIGADACCFGRWAQGARYKTRLVGRAVFVTRSAGDLRGSAVHLDRQISHVVIGLRDGGGAKGVGFD